MSGAYEPVAHRNDPKSIVNMDLGGCCNRCGVYGNIHRCLPRGAAPIDPKTFEENQLTSSHRWAFRGRGL